MKKADKVHELVIDALWDAKTPGNLCSPKNIYITAIVQSLTIIAQNTRYEEDVTNLLVEAEKYIYD